MNGTGPAHRRPTDVVNRPPPAQKPFTKLAHNDDNDLVERLAMRHERDKAQVQGILNPSQKRREQVFDDDDRHATDIERLAQDRANQKRISPSRPLPPTGPSTNGTNRRPLRFDRPIMSDESTYPPQQQTRAGQQPPQHHQQGPPSHEQGSSSHQQGSSSHQQGPPYYPQGPPYYSQEPQSRQQTTEDHQQSNVDELANRHHDEKMLMEAIRQELSERPLADDEELIVIEQ